MQHTRNTSIKKTALLIALISLTSITFAADKETETAAEAAQIQTEITCQSGTETIKLEPIYMNYSLFSSQPDSELVAREYTISFGFNLQLKERATYTVLSNWIAKNKNDINCTVIYFNKGKTDSVAQTLAFSNLEMQNLTESMNANNGMNTINTDVYMFSKKAKVKIDDTEIK